MDEMDIKYKPCPYCFCEISKEPIFEKHQGRVAVLCPHCRAHRGEWVGNVDEAIKSWNTYMRNEKKGAFKMELPLCETNSLLFGTKSPIQKYGDVLSL